jgi:hypothetical protein
VGRTGDAATVDADVVVAGMGGSLIVAVAAVIVGSLPGTGASREYLDYGALVVAVGFSVGDERQGTMESTSGYLLVIPVVGVVEVGLKNATACFVLSNDFVHHPRDLVPFSLSLSVSLSTRVIFGGFRTGFGTRWH